MSGFEAWPSEARAFGPLTLRPTSAVRKTLFFERQCGRRGVAVLTKRGEVGR